MAYTVSEVSRIAHVSVRALHHYDEIGLLEPSGRSDAGYRLYDDSDLEELQEILLFKEAGLSLEAIGDALRTPRRDRDRVLRRQRELLEEKAAHTAAMIATVDAALEARERGTAMDKEEMFEVFGDFDPEEHTEEVRKRFGPGLVRESERRTSRYTKQDWQSITAEQAEILDGIASRMERGPEDPEVQGLVIRYWRVIDERFYPCSAEVFAGLGEMYVADPRFAKYYEDVAEGLAAFMRDAIVVCTRDGDL